MVKVISAPLVDINNRDIYTGNYVEPVKVKQGENKKEKVSAFLEKKIDESNKPGFINIEGFGYVKT